MRAIDLSSVTENKTDLHNLCYCFEITTAGWPTLFLTSNGSTIKHQGIDYLPYSGLSWQEGVFNDSAQDYIYLQGIFESQGINTEFEMTFAEVRISIYSDTRLQPFVTMYCTEFIKNDLEFRLKLEPLVIKYNRSLLLPFSKTCRAMLGDAKCKIDKQAFALNAIVETISTTLVQCRTIDQPSGYFRGGGATVVLEDQIYSCQISSHFLTQIELEAWFVKKLKPGQGIVLTPGCDKKFITCCNKFDNALNFRGEPFVPEDDYLKN